jgi:rRNA maturation RNase YbeY
MLKINFLVEPHYLVDRKIIRKAANLVAQKVNLKVEAEMTVSIIGDRKMRTLNNKFRAKNSTTNVLSFTASETEKIDHFKSPTINDLYIGDVAVSYPVAVEEAIKENVLVDERVAFLVVHGLLHLFAYDHEKNDEAKLMETIEDEVMVSLKTPEIIK